MTIKHLSTAMLLFAALALLPACSGADEKKVKHYQKALEYIKASDDKAAILELKNAIQQETTIEPIYQDEFNTKIKGKGSNRLVLGFNKFTIPDKKRLIIEIQERNGGRHFLYKLKNKSLLGAEEVFRSLQEQKTEDEADRILRRISR